MSFDLAFEVFLRTLGDADEVDTFNAELTDEEEREQARLGSELSRQHCR